ncbi:MAG: type II toxin-antitoxin system RelE/ParE family toxin [Acidaminococcus sp.]|jgi:phage-related protein|nr:type II toxin-antitoxin system RelE/ParE family toxin [Acidaminococcus sp.]MCI2101069.1 type II toxin-antitoxin system RelE/ParE family toxin [Acidaminococcus sp.]MCI2115480.1 type II toxin-antitoxin system RelE/ParE family toxin [Acidaminococcus sp.]MCI2117596.1 type II toxin-antitoxin system RelE/ParE family toxin [Acidaminococcus sp.]
MNFTVEFYETCDGFCPVLDFFRTLDEDTRVKISSFITLLQHNGNSLREPYSKPLKNGIFELRVRKGSNSFRVLYFFYVEHRIIMTNGFIKKQNKTPKSEIEKAIKYRNDFLSRGGK